MQKDAKGDDPDVRINIILPLSERDAFDRWCRYGGKPKQSMNWRIRALIREDMKGKLHVPRTPSPRKAPAKRPAK